MAKISSVAIVGAGIAGLSCAAPLRAAGLAVTLFDKGKRPGGRVATRRADGIAFNHGAQYMTARTPEFGRLIAGLHSQGVVASWPCISGQEDRWVGTPGMSALPGEMAACLIRDDASLLTSRHVAFLHAVDHRWHVRHLDASSAQPGAVVADGGDVATGFDAVLLALPAPQAALLLRAIKHRFAEPLSEAGFAPCWAAMVAFDTHLDRPETDKPSDGPLAWIAREGSRPGRAPSPDAWMLHATAAWSRANLERDGAAVLADLIAAFAPDVPTPIHMSAHRWRYAFVEQPLNEPCLWDAQTQLGICGDFCIGPRVEAAWLSGAALASTVLSHI